MTNDPELNGKYLGIITQDFVKISSFLREACYQVRARKISPYPIVVMSREAGIGQVLVDSRRLGLAWQYALSYLDEFVQRGLIQPDREAYFVENYLNPDEFCCLFVIDVAQNFTNFVYVPYPEDE